MKYSITLAILLTCFTITSNAQDSLINRFKKLFYFLQQNAIAKHTKKRNRHRTPSLYLTYKKALHELDGKSTHQKTYTKRRQRPRNVADPDDMRSLGLSSSTLKHFQTD